MAYSAGRGYVIRGAHHHNTLHPCTITHGCPTLQTTTHGVSPTRAAGTEAMDQYLTPNDVAERLLECMGNCAPLGQGRRTARRKTRPAVAIPAG